jgi:hypothetical protein
MRRDAFRLSFVLAGLCLAVSVFAQEGHPLTGTWEGDWGATANERSHVTIVMSWDGQRVTGTINPGPDAVPIGSVFVDVTNWTIRIAADTKDGAGAPVHIAAEGKLDDIGSYHRRITGTWKQGTTQGDFRITRD